MTAAFLIPCLVQLRVEFNQQNPGRDKGADGWIGDAAHQTGTSDHNPDSAGRVLAIDIDESGPWPRGNSLGDYVEFIRQRQDSGADTRLEYIIHNHHIASRSAQDWEWRTYTGTDPHTNHAHFSARHDHAGQNDTSAWQLGEVGEAVMAQVSIDTDSVQRIASKIGGDTQTDASGIAIGLRKQVTNATDARFDALEAAVANLQAQLNVVAGWDLSADSKGGDASEAQEQIADAVWKNDTRTTTA
jgi:hypothetical protein